LRNRNRAFPKPLALVFAAIIFWIPTFAEQNTFRSAPASAAAMRNPYAGKASAAMAGNQVYTHNCAQCHGRNLEGMGPAPALDTARIRQAKPGELFWFITNGKPSSGMPAWGSLPKTQLWEVVTFLQSKPAPAN
jgi:mono/diheme cytochrome c family protein